MQFSFTDYSWYPQNKQCAADTSYLGLLLGPGIHI